MNRTTAFAFICTLAPATGFAQAYPVKSVRYIVPSLPGGGSDILGRMMAAHMSQTFKQQVVVDNRAGGGGNIGAEIGARSVPDGHTIFQMAVTHAINVTLYRNLGYDIVRDFAPVTRLASSPLVVTVHASLPAKTIAELVQLAKAKPGSINYASAGTGTATYFAVELFKGRAGIDLVHVPYKGGGGAQTSILAGETSVYFANIVTALPHIQQGRLRALAVTSPKRVSLMPDYPTVGEAGYPGYQSETWFGLMLPVKTPRTVVTAVRNAALAALNAPDFGKRLLDMAFIAVGDSPAEYAAYIQSEIATYGKLVRELKVTSD
jgi:tripartite-type tricarboxylate transporter receptor subunit TctC